MSSGWADALQWVGVVSIIVVSAAIVGAVRRAPELSIATGTASVVRSS